MSFPGILTTLGEARADCRGRSAGVCGFLQQRQLGLLLHWMRADEQGKAFSWAETRKDRNKKYESARNNCPEFSQRGLQHYRGTGVVRAEGGLGYLGIHYQTKTGDRPTMSYCSGEGKWTRENNINEETFYIFYIKAFILTATHSHRHTKHQKNFLTGTTDVFTL